MADMKKCAHPMCKCMTIEKYCSNYCKDAGDKVEIACDCKHAGCTK